MLKLSSCFHVPIVIDGETLTLDIKRFPTPDAANEFLFSFDRHTKEADRVDGTLDEQHAREREARKWICEAIDTYVSLQPGQLEDDGQVITTGDGLVRAFASRQAILSHVVALIRLENTISQPDREFRRAMLAPFVPSPPEVIEAMLDAAAIGAGDTVIDVGCGTGALLIAAAQRGANAIGYELHAGRAREALQAAAAAGVADLVHVHRQDASMVPADVWRAAKAVLMYLLPEPHKALGAKLKTAMLPGSRVVCHAYPLGEDWLQSAPRYVPQSPIDGMTPESQTQRFDAAVGWVYSYEVP